MQACSSRGRMRASLTWDGRPKPTSSTGKWCTLEWRQQRPRNALDMETRGRLHMSDMLQHTCCARGGHTQCRGLIAHPTTCLEWFSAVISTASSCFDMCDSRYHTPRRTPNASPADRPRCFRNRNLIASRRVADKRNLSDPKRKGLNRLNLQTCQPRHRLDPCSVHTLKCSEISEKTKALRSWTR